MRKNQIVREADIAVGLLVREILHAPNWKHINDCAQAIFHVRLMQVSQEKETIRHVCGNGGTFAASPWVPCESEAVGSGGAK